MTAKDIFKIVAVFGVFFVVAPYLLRAAFWLFNKPRIEVGFATPVEGRITGIYMNRQYYLYYLNGNEKVYYDFNVFVPSTASPVTTNLPQDEVTKLILAGHLRVGDYVAKAANSTELTVRRGDTTTHWICERD